MWMIYNLHLVWLTGLTEDDKDQRNVTKIQSSGKRKFSSKTHRFYILQTGTHELILRTDEKKSSTLQGKKYLFHLLDSTSRRS